MRRKLWVSVIIIVASVVILAGAGTVALYLGLFASPVAEVLLLVNPPRTTGINPERVLLTVEMMERLVQTRVQSIKTQQVFQLAIDDIRQTEWFNEALKDSSGPVQRLLDQVNVEPVPDTNMIRIWISGCKRVDAVAIVNAIAKAAVNEAKEDSNRGLSKTIERLSNLREEQVKKRDKSIERIQKFHRLGIGGVPIEEQNTLLYRQQYMVQAMSRIRPMYAQALESWKRINALTDKELAEFPEIRQSINEDEVIKALELRLIDPSIDLGLAKKRKDEAKVKELKDRIEVIKQEIDKREIKVTAESIALLKKTRKSQFQGLEAQFVMLLDQIEEKSEELKILDTLLTSLKQAEDTRDQAVLMIDQLDIRLMDLRLLKDGEPPLVLHRRAQLDLRLD